MGGYLSESGIFLKGCVIIYVFVLTLDTQSNIQSLHLQYCSDKPKNL